MLSTDTRAFMWTYDRLDEDHELEHFFSGFRSSKVVIDRIDPLPSLTEEGMRKLYSTLRGSLDRTFLVRFAACTCQILASNDMPEARRPRTHTP